MCGSWRTTVVPPAGRVPDRRVLFWRAAAHAVGATSGGLSWRQRLRRVCTLPCRPWALREARRNKQPEHGPDVCSARAVGVILRAALGMQLVQHALAQQQRLVAHLPMNRH